jgi:DNA end-binding protein Ku
VGARAIWKGVLKIGSSELAVKLYSAVQDRDVRFHVLQSRTKSRVKQDMVAPETGKKIAREDIRKGYEVEPGTFILIEDEELERLKPKPSRTINATRFVPPSVIGPEWYERSYYLGPESAADQSKYLALAEALRNREVQGIARWSMRERSYVGALRAEGDYLVLV